jgi:hypothetical protein
MELFALLMNVQMEFAVNIILLVMTEICALTINVKQEVVFLHQLFVIPEIFVLLQLVQEVLVFNIQSIVMMEILALKTLAMVQMENVITLPYLAIPLILVFLKYVKQKTLVLLTNVWMYQFNAQIAIHALPINVLITKEVLSVNSHQSLAPQRMLATHKAVPV